MCGHTTCVCGYTGCSIQHVSLDTHAIVLFKLIAVSNTLVLLPTETITAKFLPVCH